MEYNIEKIINIFEKSNLFKMELEIEGIKIKLQKDNIEKKEHTEQLEGTKVLSPVVGTYYNKNNFIKEGSIVKKGDILCVIEAMKVMNEITAPINGTILKVFKQNEELVDYDQVLFLIG